MIYRETVRHYYKGALIVFLAFDLTEDKEASNLSYWLEEIHSEKLQEATVFLIGCKADE